MARTRKKRNKIRRRQKKRPLFWSSLIFTTNMTTAAITGLPLYSFLFACLTITSLVVHTEYNIATCIIDKIAIALIVIYGGYRMWLKRNSSAALLSLCILTFLFCVLVYVYGFLTDQFCFSTNATSWHILMHFIGSIGHQFIIFL